MNIKITKSKSPLTFETTGGGDWKIWDRFIAIEGKKAYHIGNVCGTCSFFFERMDGANQSLNPKALQERLNSGSTTIGKEDISILRDLLPNGKYIPAIESRVPKLIAPGADDDYFINEQVKLWGLDGFWGLPHHPKTEYYRLGSYSIGDGKGLYEFLVPMFPKNWLDTQRVDEYKQSLDRLSVPTALALSVLDVKQPADWEGEPEINSHWCLAHYILDGHHKVYAASENDKTIKFVSFYAVDEGVSSSDELSQLIEYKKSNNFMELI